MSAPQGDLTGHAFSALLGFGSAGIVAFLKGAFSFSRDAGRWDAMNTKIDDLREDLGHKIEENKRYMHDSMLRVETKLDRIDQKVDEHQTDIAVLKVTNQNARG
jgi:hypothetical protein